MQNNKYFYKKYDMKRLLIICVIILFANNSVIAQEDRLNILFSIEEIDNYSINVLPHVINYLYDLCVDGYKNGHITNAINYSNKALYIIDHKLDGEHPNRGEFLRILAISYDKIGDFTKGLQYHQLEIEYFEKYKNNRFQDYVLSLFNLACHYGQSKDFDNAINSFIATIPIIKSSFGSDNIIYAQALCNFANCYSAVGDSATAIEYYKQAQIIYQKNKIEDEFYGILCCNMAYTYYKRDDYISAIDLCRHGLDLISNYAGDTDEAYIHHIWNLSMYYYKATMTHDLIRCWKRCVDLTSHYVQNQLGWGLLSSKQRRIFWNRIISEVNNYTKIYSYYIASKETSDSFWYDTFTNVSYNSILISKGGLLKFNTEISTTIYKEGLSDSYDDFENSQLISNDNLTFSIVKNNEVLQQRLFLRETHFMDIKCRHILNKLGNKDVAIEILTADEYLEKGSSYYAALVLRRGWIAPKYVELCSTEELQAYFDNYNSLAMMYRDANSRKLYNLIWDKLAMFINEGDNVYFAPDGLLYQMNIEVFQDANGKRANEKWNLHRVSSTRELCMEKPEIDMTSAVLYGNLLYDVDSTTMVAESRTYRQEDNYVASRGFVQDSTMRDGWNRLVATNTEINSIAMTMQACGIEPTIYKLETGNEESFKALSGKKTPIIHLATHGFFYKDEEAKTKPFFETLDMNKNNYALDNSLKRSGLILAGAQKAWLGEPIPDNVEDGVLLAEEIATMDLTGTDLVVLSACETGLGEITSEGVFGLQRAFKKAGVQTLIMSLWKVDDNATSLFMRTFYKQWLGWKSKHAAFLDAQAAVRECKESDYSNPYYWASFIMLD